MVLNIIGFLLCAGLITWSGSQLSRQGNRLAELTGLSRAWIGIILMATITSLPELVTGFSSVVIVKANDLAVGNVIGSCAFNLLILALLDIMRNPANSIVKTSHVLTGSLSIVLLTCAGLAILLAPTIPTILWISPFTPLVMIIYVAGMREINLNERTDSITNDKESSSVAGERGGLRRVLLTYTIHALIVTIAALVLPEFGESIAAAAGLSDSFFGTVFLAATTSLPELVVSITALRIGSLDMAIGNLLGSNVFNVAILALLDLVYTSDSLYSNISDNHSFSILATIGMTAVVVIGLATRSAKKALLLSIHTWIVLIAYVLMVLELGVT